MLIKRQQDLSELISALSFFIFFILYPSVFTAHLMAYLLHSFFIRQLLCGLITTIALLRNSRIIMSFIVLIRVSVSPGSVLHLHGSQREIYEGSRTDGFRRTAGKYLYAAVWRRILESHQLSCKSGLMWCKSMQLYMHGLNKSVMQLQLVCYLLNQSGHFFLLIMR